jgi:hypothetical protein
MSETPTSKSQQRAIRVKALAGASTYTEASQILENAGLPGDGIPRGETWRSAAKLTDQQLDALLRSNFSDDDFDTVPDGQGGWQ